MPVHGPHTAATATPRSGRLRVPRTRLPASGARPTLRTIERPGEPPTATALTWIGRWTYEPGVDGAVALPVEHFASGTYDHVQIVRPPSRASARLHGGDVVLAFRHNGYFADSFVVRVTDTATGRWATATIDFDVAANPRHAPCWG